ncbi:hypothetical protein WICPIJ_003790 [Wickerhamomyces pijperi]|uniref:Uncharacterized protein n=1 Tax=Wickerhamomyces pijperi TaxID=599730 RepID=A0A9P8TNE4_WICPI|nr:hypothetical protein WICPIJ_003790 [Wickerhamomyces pijperi]
MHVEPKQIDNHSKPNGNKSKDTDIFGGDDQGQRHTGGSEPGPPFSREHNPESLLVGELGVAENRQRNRDNQRGIQQDQSRLGDMRVVEKNQRGPEQSCDNRRAISQIRSLVGDVRVSNVVKLERPVVADEVPDKGNEHLGERRMQIEEVGSLQIVRCKLTEMNFIENNFIWVLKLIESGEESNRGENDQRDVALICVGAGTCCSLQFVLLLLYQVI